MEGQFPQQAPQQEQPPMNMGIAAELLGLDSSATAEQIVAAYDAIMEADKKTSEWAPERSTLDENGIPAQLDWFVEDLRKSESNSSIDSNPERLGNVPSMVTIAESLQNLGFNVTESDTALMREAIQELIDKKDDGIHSLPVGAEKALGM